MAHLITRLKCRSGQLEKGITMKKNKLWLFLAGILTLNAAAALTLTGCDNPTIDDKPEEPKPQTGTVNFGDNLSATVEGTFKDSEWEKVKENVKYALNEGLTDARLGAIFNLLFINSNPNVIILENTEQYTTYSTELGSPVIKINTSIINNKTTLLDAIKNAVDANTGGSAPLQVMNHDRGWKRYGQTQRNIDNHIASSRVRHRLG